MAAQTTYTFALKDKYSSTIFSDATFAENTTTTRFADKYGGTSEYQLLRTPVIGDLTLTITTTQDTQATVSGFLYIEQNGVPNAYGFSITIDTAKTGTDTITVQKGYLVGIVSTATALVSPSVSPSASLSLSLSPSFSPSISPSLSPSVSSSVSPSASISSSVSPSLSASISPSVSPSTA